MYGFDSDWAGDCGFCGCLALSTCLGMISCTVGGIVNFAALPSSSLVGNTRHLLASFSWSHSGPNP